MKITKFERVFIIGISLVLNKLFLFWLIGASSVFGFLVAFVLLVLNFMVLAKTVDKVIDAYEALKKKQISSTISRLMKH